MLKRSNSATAHILEFLYDSPGPALRSFASIFSRVSQKFQIGQKEFYNIIRDLKRRGIVNGVKKSDTEWIELTDDGELEVLFLKASVNPTTKWDGKWRLVIFDIPEDARAKRNLLRTLLYKNGFLKLQASVFIGPWQLNREAITYLQKSGLIKFIRIARVDEMDNDGDLRKNFHLK